jgi:protein tyrosine phosphatase (PTP) superfamily phosphohydrolase (DUF442 family)
MDTPRQRSPFIAVAAQLQSAATGSLAAAGFSSAANNRPHAEGENQPSCAFSKEPEQ